MIVVGRDRTFNTKYDSQKPMKNVTDITVILDRSGSMASVVDSTINGFNEFVTQQQNAPGRAVLSLVQFDDKYETVYEQTSVKSVKLLTEDTFVPRGMTALNDAIGRTIHYMGKRLESTSKSNRPEKVIIVIITDGFENASINYDTRQVSDMVKHQQDKYSWEFLFLGANQDAVMSGSKYSISAGRSMSYAANAVGTTNAFFAAASNVVSLRADEDGDFTDLQRKKAMETENE